MTSLAERIRAEGGLLAPTAQGDVDGDLAVEAIREGERVHFGDPLVVRTDDADLGILAGDHLYALGLSELAARGDLPGVAALAGVIARCAQAHAENRPEDAAAAWAAFESGQETV